MKARAGPACPEATLTSVVPTVPALAAPPAAPSQSRLPTAGLCMGSGGHSHGLRWPWGHRGTAGRGQTPAKLPTSKETPNPCGLLVAAAWGRAPQDGRAGLPAPGLLRAAGKPGEPAPVPARPRPPKNRRGRRRLTHGRVLEAEISRSSAGADVAAAARARGLAQGVTPGAAGAKPSGRGRRRMASGLGEEGSAGGLE